MEQQGKCTGERAGVSGPTKFGFQCMQGRGRAFPALRSLEDGVTHPPLSSRRQSKFIHVSIALPVTFSEA